MVEFMHSGRVWGSPYVLVTGWWRNSSGTSLTTKHMLHLHLRSSMKLTNGFIYVRQRLQRTIEPDKEANPKLFNTCVINLMNLPAEITGKELKSLKGWTTRPSGNFTFCRRFWVWGIAFNVERKTLKRENIKIQNTIEVELGKSATLRE